MIFSYALSFVLWVIGFPFSWLPHVLTLPFGMDSLMLTLMADWYGLLQVAWPLQALWNCFLFLIPIEVSLIVLKIILGAHIVEL